MIRIYKLVLAFLMIFWMTGCDQKPNLGAKTVHWDRDMCERCRMVLSDRRFSAQVVHPDTGKTYLFDDIGCAILWFKENKIDWADRAVIWVNDVKTTSWIDARKAFYDVENITPMAYGFGAHLDQASIVKEQEIIDFDEVKRRVIKIGK